jgi:phenylacetate-CoA ligase
MVRSPLEVALSDSTDMYSTAFRALRRFYPGGGTYYARQRLLARTQWLSHEELAAWQLLGLQGIVKHAYENVPFYRELYGRAGAEPEDIRTFEDFEALPFLTREDVREHLEDLVAPALRDQALPNSTGGSTGMPMQFYHEKAYGWWDPALELRGRGWYGVHDGDKLALVWGANRDMHTEGLGARLKARIQRERYLNAFEMTRPQMRAYAEMLVRWQPVMVRAYASALCLFAEFVRDEAIAGIRPKLIEITAEKVFPWQRELLEEVFGCPVADWYAAREFGTIGFECPEGSLHVGETRYIEVVADGKVAEPGQMGEVTITSLHQKAMPFIRYRIGDMAVAAPEPCSCGRGLPALQEVVGRVQDFLIAADGHLIYGGYLPHTFRLWPEIERFQAYQPDRQHLEVRIVASPRDDPTWLERLDHELHLGFGEDMQIDLLLVDEIPLTAAGKHRVVISDITSEFTGGSPRG